MEYDVIVIGAGHAGSEAALAAARMDCQVLLLTLNADTIGLMSCNPAIGGVGKAQLVKEIDALGGEMAKATDVCGIQFRILNASKGAAVQSARAQVDRLRYREYMTGVVLSQKNLFLREGEVLDLIIKDAAVKGIIARTCSSKKEEISAACVVICSGTFLAGLIHVGLKHYPGGRMNEPPSMDLAESLSNAGFKLLRFKTGTCARLERDSINFSHLAVQRGDLSPQPFSFSTKEITQEQIPCYITYTNENTHKIIRENLDKSPLYAGIIKATGVRYCPSIEDKVVKFSDKERHQIFLEPEGKNIGEVYPNGLSTSLPEEVQLKILHSIAGLEEARVIRFGYGIEYTVVEPTQLYPTLETKLIRNLYLAGQINGTTGYEEAAAQGLIAGINAALRVKSAKNIGGPATFCGGNKEAFILDRSSSYIGVLIDDLVSKGTNEPYRMFTSRVEYRLILRQDNADLRLRHLGYQLGLVSKEEYLETEKKNEAIEKGINFLRHTYIKPQPALKIRKALTLEEFLKRPGVTLKTLKDLSLLNSEIAEFAKQQIEIEVKYAGFIQRQRSEVEKFRSLEKIRIPPELNYNDIPGLSAEIREKLSRFKPLNLGQALRISGVTPVAISILMVYLRKVNAP